MDAIDWRSFGIGLALGVALVSVAVLLALFM